MRLHLAYWELNVVLGDFSRVQRVELWLVCHTIGKFTHRAEDSGAVSLQLACFLAHSELDSKPVNCCKSLDLVFTGAKGSQTDILTEFSEVGVGKHGRMTQQLVDNVWFRCVERR